jgi:hypothetical protein
MTDRPFKIALMWSGDRETRRSATPDSTRLAGIFDALVALGIQAEPAVYADDMVDEMEAEWTLQMIRVLDIDADSLPLLWDADFLYGPRSASGDDTYVLCEINVSSVIPFPEQVPAAVAQLVLSRLRAAKR